MLKNCVSRSFKKVQMQGARQIDERRRTVVVRWSETMERNDADETFSTTWQKEGG
jgi:hypothetical protein